MTVKTIEKQIDKKAGLTKTFKEALLNQLPEEVRKKWEKSSVGKIEEIIRERQETGFERVINGYHCSDKNFEVGDFILPGDDNCVHYATNTKKLYGKKAKFLYILEGSGLDTDSDSGLGWKTSFAKMKIIGKVPLTHEKVDELDLDFAECDYS
ncbi:MAG: hypothetical protein PHT40_03035 [Patescibacteria group bacterium]|nr:hypothetical protein [Patescibacteria group bacterium]